MSTSCVQTPTLTSTSIDTSESIFTTTSLSTSTLTDATSTTIITTTICTPTNSTSVCVPTSTSSIITVPGGTTTITIPITSTTEILSTNFITLFGSSCTTLPTPPPDTTPPPTSNPPSTTPPPPPSNTVTDTQTSTSTSPLPTSPSTTSDGQTGTPSLISDNKAGGKGTNVGPIVGGVVGGVAALLLLAFITWKLIKKQSRFDDIFNHDRTPHYKKRTSLLQDDDLKPTYNYGLVGQHPAPVGSLNSHLSDPFAPNSPPPTQTSLGGNANYTPDPNLGPGSSAPSGQPVSGQDMAPQAQPPQVHHLRNPSLTPLLAGAAVAAVGAGAGAVGATSSRPSSSASTSTSPGLLVTNAIPGQGPGYFPVGDIPPVPSSSNANTNSSYPPALQNYTSNQGYLTSGSNNSSGATNTQGYGSGPSMAGPSTLSHNTSATSSTLTSSSAPSWGPAPLVPVPAGALNPIQPRPLQHQQVQHLQAQQYEDPFLRNGSPVSFQERRILQVTNAEPEEIYDPNAYYNEGVTGASSTNSRNSVQGPMGRARVGRAGLTDGKGRPINVKGEKQPIVHLDGGLYQDRPQPSNTPGPPAYDA